MKWIEINEKNKPTFKKQYLLGKAKKNLFKPERVYFGCLDEIEVTENGERYIYSIEQQKDFGDPDYSRTDEITHFIEIDDLPNVA
jgi:hypothetical protein